jgi:cyclic-di-GMP phosphodiesterase, flagellum assembly factor TipF
LAEPVDELHEVNQFACALRLAEAIHPVISFCFDRRNNRARNSLPIVYHVRMHGHELKVQVLRIKPSLTKLAGIGGLALLVLAATSEGVVSRDLVAALAISLSIAAFAAAMLAYRQGKEMQRSAQDYFANIENAARRLERDRLLLDREPHEPDMTPVRRGSAAAKPADAAHAPRLALGIRPTVIEGGKAKAERLNAEMSAADDALLVALDAHAVSVSLEPVVELRSSKVAAYRVHAHVTNADGTSANLRRLEGNHPGIDPARFDMELFHAAAGAARRLLGGTADITPLICPISAATLGSPKDLRKIVAMMNNLPGLKSGLVLEMPAASLGHDDIMLSGAGLLADAAIRLCVEGRLEARRLRDIAGRFEIEFWSMSGAEVCEADISQLTVSDRDDREAKVIARGIAEDYEVVAMIDAGVQLVCGPRFSDPKPVRTLSADAPPDRGRISQP